MFACLCRDLLLLKQISRLHLRIERRFLPWPGNSLKSSVSNRKLVQFDFGSDRKKAGVINDRPKVGKPRSWQQRSRTLRYFIKLIHTDKRVWPTAIYNILCSLV